MFSRRRKSKPAQAASLVGDYLKLKTAGKAARGAGKTAGKTAKTVVAYKGTKGFVKRLPWIAGAAAGVGGGGGGGARERARRRGRQGDPRRWRRAGPRLSDRPLDLRRAPPWRGPSFLDW